ncbi:MAG: SUMF1/EgtB/PvdO family nonheme iron enzyme [Pseudomonadota bacterium]
MQKFCALFTILSIISASTLAVDEKTSDAKASSKAQTLALPEMIKIPAGSFRMGNINNFVPLDPFRAKKVEAELPVHKVKIKAFKLSKYEITFAQYDAFAEATGKAKPNDEGNGRGQQPVGNITWWEATDYAQWLSQRTGKNFRLASEAEWQYAVRAGTTSEYYWGESADHTFANYGTDKCCDLFASGADKWLHAAPVGQFPANKFGLHDMLGNVSEFVQDCWNPNYEGAPTDGSAWTTGDCKKHVTLGGQYHSDPFWLRVSARINHPAPEAERNINFGFRIAQDTE